MLRRQWLISAAAGITKGSQNGESQSLERLLCNEQRWDEQSKAGDVDGR